MSAVNSNNNQIQGALNLPEKFRMTIHVGMLQSMGINMYTSIGKSLVEFIANAYDSDSSVVEIDLPFDKIDAARNEVRELAKKEVQAGKREAFTSLYEPLPDSISITIKDDGHGMTAEEIEDKFLVVNRNRRDSDGLMTESGNRVVMGRKGIGKLAGFGAAERIRVRSKRKGQTYATVFDMDFDEIKNKESVNEVEFTPKYEYGLDEDEQGTTILLSSLRCDALKASKDSIIKALAQNFLVVSDDFLILLNEEGIEEDIVDYEYIYPEESKRNKNGFGTETVNVEDIFSFDIEYVVKFRARADENIQNEDQNGNDSDQSDIRIRGHLPAKMRGARIYCNKRLAEGPTLLNLHTGMHNFHSQSYMECIVHADDLDKHNVDLISTNRSDLKTDNDIVDALHKAVTEIMRLALREHAKFRKNKAEEEIEQDEFSKRLLNQIKTLPNRTRIPARKALNIVASHAGVTSKLYREIAPIMVQTMNAGEVLTKLIELGADPKSITVVAQELAELNKVENSDVLKLYRGRKNGIQALSTLQDKAVDQWKGKKFEGELHALLKESPWLIKPEYSHYLTSDKTMGTVARKLDSELQIDTAISEKEDAENNGNRPDLVFVLVNSDAPDTVSVVELKSPNIELDNNHLTQLESYMMQVRETIQVDFQKTDVKVHGHLIGTLPKADTSANMKRLLLQKIKEQGPSTQWEVISIPMLLERSRLTHLAVIEALENQEVEEEEEGSAK